MNENHFSKWSESDKDFLKENYKKMRIAEISIIIGRTIDAISSKAYLMGLRKKIELGTNFAPEKEILELFAQGTGIPDIMQRFSISRNTITMIINEGLKTNGIKTIYYDDDHEDKIITLKPIEDYGKFLRYANKMTVSHDNLASGRDKCKLVGTLTKISENGKS